jgi:hypothetical protein
MMDGNKSNGTDLNESDMDSDDVHVRWLHLFI